MPSINDFINKKPEKDNNNYEKLGGIRGCSNCDLEVEGALWDPSEKVLFWECPNGHMNRFQMQ